MNTFKPKSFQTNTKMTKALKNVSGSVFRIDPTVLNDGIIEAQRSPRKRMILPLHRTQDSTVQRLINFVEPKTYIRPHKHPRRFASETIIVIQGCIQFFTFDDEGNLTFTTELNDNFGENLIDIEPNVWHSFIVREPETILYEFKMGPYDEVLDKTFAPWSPEEGSEESQTYLEQFDPYKM